MYLLKQNGEYRVFDIISDIITRERIISIDIMSKPFCDTPATLVAIM